MKIEITPKFSRVRCFTCKGDGGSGPPGSVVPCDKCVGGIRVGCNIAVKVTNDVGTKTYKEFLWFEDRKTHEEALACAVAFGMDLIKIPTEEMT